MAQEDEIAVEAKTKAEAKAEAKEEKAAATVEEEAKLLGVAKSKMSMSGFKDNKPEKIEKEKARQTKKVNSRLEKNVAKAKAVAKMKPIDKRRKLLANRLAAVKSRTRPKTYTDAIIKAWIEEYNMITNNPKSWNKVTKNGTVGYTPGSKKKKTAQDILDSMDLEEE